jgi:Ca2+-binding RTX toxin-like protein
MGDGGADALAGGPGVDSVDYSGRATPIVFSLDGAPGDGAANEGDRVAADIEGVLTGSGDDTVTGSPGADVLATGSGDDTIDAGGGEDQVDAGAGADRLALRDGAADTVDCGEGRDEADGDDNDAAGGCEVLRTPGNPSGGPKPPTGGLPALVMPSGIEMRLNGRPRRGRLRLTGRLVLPAGTDPRLCAGGAVRVAVKAGRKRPKVTEVLGADCGFSTSLSVRVRKNTRAIVRASFSGTAFLAGAVSAPMKVTLRR